MMAAKRNGRYYVIENHPKQNRPQVELRPEDGFVLYLSYSVVKIQLEIWSYSEAPLLRIKVSLF